VPERTRPCFYGKNQLADLGKGDMIMDELIQGTMIQEAWDMERSSSQEQERIVSASAGSSDRRFLGIDIGSVSSDVVVLDSEGEILFSDYGRTRGRSIETLRGQLDLLGQSFPDRNFVTAVTGSTGRLAAEILDVPYVNEVMAQAAAIAQLYPDLSEATVIDMGGQDSKLIFLDRSNGRLGMRDFALNSACAAGTGAFLDQQAQRLGIEIEQFGAMALNSRMVPRMAGRCSVFAKSDMIHLQQQATPVSDILAGLCQALARGLKSNLGCGRAFVEPILFTGGVAANAGVVRAFEQAFELAEGKLIVPPQHLFTGAMGAVWTIRQQGILTPSPLRMDRLDSYLAGSGNLLQSAPRRVKLEQPHLPPPASRVHDEILRQATEPIDAYLGVDVGSISTNIVVMDSQMRVLSKEYLMTAGNPL
jgi:predicted CoA-substrate-specific enzyme activase